MKDQINPRFSSNNRDALKRARRKALPLPSVLEIHPSPICQLHCVYCHSLSSVLENTLYDNQDTLLEPSEYLRLFIEFSTLGGKELVISGGGEPFLYPQIIDVIHHGFECGLRPHIYTNGYTKRFFEASKLGDWLPNIASIRFSIHKTNKMEIPLQSLHNVILNRMQTGIFAKIHASILVDTFSHEELINYIDILLKLCVDAIELRIIIPSSSETRQLLVDSYNNIATQFKSSKIVTRISSSIPSVPLKCFSLYRNIVVDPFGGYRLCCMRAHYPHNDFSYIVSLQDKKLNAALKMGMENMQSGGSAVCELCSARDSYFSRKVTTP